MTRYIIRRVLQAIPLLLLISVVVFSLANAMPSGLMAAYENNPNITKEDLVRLQEELGLDRLLAYRVHGSGTYFEGLEKTPERFAETAVLPTAHPLIAWAGSLPDGAVVAQSEACSTAGPAARLSRIRTPGRPVATTRSAPFDSVRSAASTERRLEPAVTPAS